MGVIKIKLGRVGVYGCGWVRGCVCVGVWVRFFSLSFCLFYFFSFFQQKFKQSKKFKKFFFEKKSKPPTISGEKELKTKKNKNKKPINKKKQ